MTRSKWLVSILLGLLLIGGAFFFLREKAELPVEAPPPQAASPSLSPEVEKFKSAPPMKRVQELYQEESARIGNLDPDPEGTQRRLEELSKQLTKEEMDWLKSQALDTNVGGDARFFATYLLALSGKPEAVASLREIGLAEIPKSKNQGLTELERQIRGHAAEGLGRLRGVSEARDALLDIVQYQQDEFVRDRAHRANHQWVTGKTVEEQDKEGLGKVLYGK